MIPVSPQRTSGRLLAPLALLVAAALLAGCASRSADAPVDRAALIARLTKQADAWDKAIVAKDSLAIVGNMADDFRQIDGEGGVHALPGFVADLMSPDLVIDPYTVEDFDVRIYGDVALLCGRTRMTGRYQGEPFTSHYRYVDTYVKHGDAWKVANVQITRMPPGDEAK